MQLAIIGSKDEILEVMKYVQGMQVISQSDHVTRVELTSKFENHNVFLEHEKIQIEK